MSNLTVTRASPESLIAADGTLFTVPAGVAAIGAHGLQVFQASTNICLESQTLASAAVPVTPWAVVTSGGTIDVLGAAAVSPDGTTTATRVTLGTGGYNEIYQPIALTAGVYTLSFWARTVTGTATLAYDVWDGTTGQATTASLTTTWQRFAYTVTVATGSGFIEFGPTHGATPIADFYLWGVQIEASPVATPYIPTTTVAVSRAADVITVPVAVNMVPSSTTTTNYIDYSNNPYAGWSTANGGGAAATQCFRDWVADPLGNPAPGYALCRLDHPAINTPGEYSYYVAPIESFTSSGHVTVSFWAKLEAGLTGTEWMTLYDGTTYFFRSFSITDTWTRYSVTIAMSTCIHLWFGPDTMHAGSDEPTTQPAIGCWIWGVQVENSATMGTFVPVPTAGPVSTSVVSGAAPFCFGIKATPSAAWNTINGVLFQVGPGNLGEVNSVALANTLNTTSLYAYGASDIIHWYSVHRITDSLSHKFIVYSDGLGHFELYQDGIKQTLIVYSGTGAAILAANQANIVFGRWTNLLEYTLNGSIAKFVQGHSVREVAAELAKL